MRGIVPGALWLCSRLCRQKGEGEAGEREAKERAAYQAHEGFVVDVQPVGCLVEEIHDGAQLRGGQAQRRHLRVWCKGGGRGKKGQGEMGNTQEPDKGLDSGPR